MTGRLVEAAARVLDRAAGAVKRDNPGERPEHLRTGQRGEDDAFFYLRRLGYVMVARNWRSLRHRGELDLVGWDGEVLCFVEVKSRTTRQVAPAEAAVDRQKRRDLGAVARDFLHHIKGNPEARFDIISVYYEASEKTPHITLFKNAFPMP
ncbi:MAG: YraN family protein [Terriglobales bacterium]